jgi:predicted nucleotidyltransferase
MDLTDEDRLQMSRTKILETLAATKPNVHQNYKADLKGVFGSFARGEEREDSDNDILVDFRKGATFLDLAGLGNFLEEKLHRKVDLVTPAAVRKELQARIYAEMIAL